MGEELTEKEPSLEEAFAQIEEIIGKLESADISLEESFSLYQKGMGKLASCNKLLDAVEKKLAVLGEEDGTDEPV